MSWKRILVPTDFSPSAERALRTAEVLCRASGARLDIVHVVQLPAPSYLGRLGMDRGLRETWTRGAREELDGLIVGIHGVDVEGILREGKPWKEILDLARERDADLVCIGNSGRSTVERLLLGSTVENVVRHADVPVLIVRDRTLSDVRRILLPVAFDPGTRSAVRFTLERFPDAELSALHVVAPLPPADPVVGPLLPDLAGMRAQVRALLEEVGAGRASESVRLMADPAAAIVEAGRESDVDIIVLATHGRRGVTRAMLGSVTEKVVRHAERAVLVLPGPGRERKRPKAARTEDAA